MPSLVIKRDGTEQDFNLSKIKTAIRAAFKDVGELVDECQIDLLSEEVSDHLVAESIVEIEKIQDTVERVLMIGGYPDVAKSYILYRANRTKARKKRKGLRPDPRALADYIHPGKYARHIASKQRREVYLETSHRSRDMHVAKFPHLSVEITDWWTKFVDTKKVLPSMRSMQFGGAKIARHNAAIYNCSYTLIDRPRVFQEIFYLLLCGCGVGFSVQQCHIRKLPPLTHVNKRRIRHFSVPDTIEGWADSLGALVDSYLTGYYIEFSYEQIRPEGAPLRLSGGKAPGHLPLKTMLEKVRELLHGCQGRHLKSIECYDLVCHIALAVLAGGIRRSSLICLFTHTDEDMLFAKIIDNYVPDGMMLENETSIASKNTHRAMSNNSAVFLRSTFDEAAFRRVLEVNRNNPFGEPGFIFTESEDYGTNPCGEIGLHPVLETTEGKVTGFSFCNLCEINAAVFTDPTDFFRAAEAAAIIGTIQATYTDFPYLGKVTEAIAQRDALLGVGITGMMDSPKIALDPTNQKCAAETVVRVNEEWAVILGIHPAARLTTIKPSGTASLELGGVASGIHPHHARRYFRRVIANPNEPVAKYFKSINPHMVEEKPDGDWCLVFPVEAPSEAVTVKDMSAMDLLDAAITTKKHWIDSGSVDPLNRSPGLTHNVSLTVHFRPEEWNAIVNRIIREKDHICAMSFLPVTSDKVYPFAPREEVATPEDEAKWKYLIENYTPVDYSKMIESEDLTSHVPEPACSGDSCDVVTIDSAVTGHGAKMIFQDNYLWGGVLFQDIRPKSTGWVWAGGYKLQRVQPGDFICIGDPKEPTCSWFRVLQGPHKTAADTDFVLAEMVSHDFMESFLS